MKKEVSPAVVGAVLAVVAVVVLFFGYRAFVVPQKKDTSGSEPYMEKVNRGEALYTPPPGIVPGSSPGGAPGGAMGGYNLKPPN